MSFISLNNQYKDGVFIMVTIDEVVRETDFIKSADRDTEKKEGVIKRKSL